MTYSSFSLGSDPGSVPTTLDASSVLRSRAAFRPLCTHQREARQRLVILYELFDLFESMAAAREEFPGSAPRIVTATVRPMISCSAGSAKFTVGGRSSAPGLRVRGTRSLRARAVCAVRLVRDGRADCRRPRVRQRRNPDRTGSLQCGPSLHAGEKCDFTLFDACAGAGAFMYTRDFAAQIEARQPSSHFASGIDIP